MKKFLWVSVAGILFVLLALIIVFGPKHSPDDLASLPSHTNPSPSEPPTPTPSVATDFLAPISDWQKRATKKHYGTFVEPGNSPVSPEVFRGFHTGTDFEILPGEENTDVSVTAACTGKILRKETARGYGGMLVQSCTYANEPVVVVYGHIRIASVTQAIGDTLTRGQKFAVLGNGYSAETGQERKHLHFGVHKGPSVVTSGYVSNKSQLSAWLDPETIF